LSGNVLQDDSLPVFIPCQSEIDKIVETVSLVDKLTKFQFWAEIARALKQHQEKRLKELHQANKALKKKVAPKPPPE
jgi:hypothetical protein